MFFEEANFQQIYYSQFFDFLFYVIVILRNYIHTDKLHFLYRNMFFIIGLGIEPNRKVSISYVYGIITFRIKKKFVIFMPENEFNIINIYHGNNVVSIICSGIFTRDILNSFLLVLCIKNYKTYCFCFVSPKFKNKLRNNCGFEFPINSVQ